MRIAIGNDHAGYDMKLVVLEYLQQLNVDIENFGTDTNDSVDYPEYAHKVSECIENKDYDYGILICGSGEGVAITANKHTGIRAALCWKNDIAKLARQHNDANILCIPARFIEKDEAIDILKTFLETEFEGGRHQARIDKIAL